MILFSVHGGHLQPFGPFGSGFPDPSPDCRLGRCPPHPRVLQKGARHDPPPRPPLRPHRSGRPAGPCPHQPREDGNRASLRSAGDHVRPQPDRPDPRPAHRDGEGRGRGRDPRDEDRRRHRARQPDRTPLGKPRPHPRLARGSRELRPSGPDRARHRARRDAPFGAALFESVHISAGQEHLA